jgi:hypothetical protein
MPVCSGVRLGVLRLRLEAATCMLLAINNRGDVRRIPVDGMSSRFALPVCGLGMA